jgi:Domain of unknown function (DUF4386)
MKNQAGSLKIERTSIFGVFSLLVAALTLTLGVVLYLHPSPSTAAQEWSNYNANQAGYVTGAYVALAWSVFSIPFVVGLGTLLRGKSRSLALAATLLSAVGILLFGIAYFIPAQALGVLRLVGNLAPGTKEAIYQAAFWYYFSVSLLVPALYAWGVGQVLFGWLVWRSRVLPSWLAVIGMISGIASFAPPIRFVQAIVLDSFMLWSFITGLWLLIVALRWKAAVQAAPA